MIATKVLGPWELRRWPQRRTSRRARCPSEICVYLSLSLYIYIYRYLLSLLLLLLLLVICLFCTFVKYMIYIYIYIYYPQKSLNSSAKILTHCYTSESPFLYLSLRASLALVQCALMQVLITLFNKPHSASAFLQKAIPDVEFSDAILSTTAHPIVFSIVLCRAQNSTRP